ncbi:DUF2796 domain-containing protein [Litoribrevibacter euphylliae]|uniref:DUF2796 domain-containing protein n=1 Tax=Litoribrevibacter euphylliae TaxID=1834034 RepID=A0ABV7HKF4_9GAMM
MKFMKSRLSLSIACVAGALLTNAAFAELRQHEAHVHGHAILNAAQEGKEVELSFEIPAMDMVGFEHQPETQAQKDKIEAIHELLEQGQKVVSFNDAARCQFEHAKIESALLAEEEHADHHDKHDEHHDEEHAHEDHDHKDHDHDEHDHEKHEGHSEFEITYHFECEQPSQLTELTVLLFKQAPSLQEIDASWFGEAVKKSELTPNSASMTLR